MAQPAKPTTKRNTTTKDRKTRGRTAKTNAGGDPGSTKSKRRGGAPVDRTRSHYKPD